MTAPDQSSNQPDRLEAVAERIDEAKQAADDVADRMHLTEDERRRAAKSGSGAPAEEAIGRATGEGAEVAPG